MPVRYILAASHTVPIDPMKRNIIDSSNSYQGTPKAMRKGIRMGDVKGNIDDHHISELVGCSKPLLSIKMDNIIGIDIGNDRV